MSAADPKLVQLGKMFIQEYYGRLDSNRRTTMHELYLDTAMMNFEGKCFKGKKEIQTKLMSPGSVATGTAAAIRHNIMSFDVAMGPVANKTVVIFVTGAVSIDGGNPLQFSQVLQIAQTGATTWLLTNDMFRFVLAQS